MSYILDALKKAEAERNLGEVPDLHAQTYTPPLMGERIGAWRTPWPWILLALLVAVAIALAIVKPWSPSPVLQSAVPQVAQQTPAPVPPSVPAVAAAPPATTPTPPAAAPAPVSKAPVIAKTEAPKPAPATHKKTPPAEPKQAQKETPPAAQPAPSQAVTQSGDDAPPPALRELPESVQQAIPKFTTNGYIYSPNKADRTVLINNKLLHEGDSVAPDLTVEKLTPSGMVLNYKGYRYRSSY
jgi:general secretion pathway protein B